MIAIDLEPFSIVEDLGFIRLINHLSPSYQISTRKYLKENIVQEIYEKVKRVIEEEINVARHLSLTSDGWTVNSANISFLSLTGHWITKNFEQTSVVLGVSSLQASQTAINISECITDTIQIFNIPHNKIHVLVRDNAVNMAAAAIHAQ